MLGVSSRIVRGYVRMGLVHPQRGPRNGHLFSFTDLVLLRSARALAGAHLGPSAVTRSLRRLRRELPPEMPANGLRVSLIGDTVVVRAGDDPWQAHGGQFLLDLSVRPAGDALAFVAHPRASTPPADTVEEAAAGYARGYALEAHDPLGAMREYERALVADPRHSGAVANLGRLLQEGGRLREALEVYDRFLAHADDALVRFNAGVALEDLGRFDDALASYERALALDPGFVDAHYNAALLCEASGDRTRALRHMAEHRRKTRPRAH